MSDAVALQAQSACILLNGAGISLRRAEEAPEGLLPTLAAGMSGVRAMPLTPEDRRRLLLLERDGFVDRELERARALSFELLNPFSPGYPELLLQIPDAPLLLYVSGQSKWLSKPAIGIVGSRNATIYGRSVAEALAHQLALRGLTIVSGFARGIDSAAHTSSLRAGGGTVAVLGCGLDVDYPRGHDDMRRRIAANGCLVSEFPLGSNPNRSTFPKRNRIISGLSLGIIVVEAQQRSGALITARHALEQNREVFAVPGSIFSATSQGTHRLLSDGAKLTEHADDVIEELEGRFIPAPLASTEDIPSTGTIESRVYLALNSNPVHVDELSRHLELPMATLMPVLSVLELKRCVRQHAGKQFTRL